MALVLSVLALLLLGLSFIGRRDVPDTHAAAAEMGRRVDSRLEILDRYISAALSQPTSDWMLLDGLPADMVVYRYSADTLQYWAHQFPLRNDDIRPRTLVQRLGDTRTDFASPLASVGSEFSFVNYGPKWYLVKSVRSGDAIVIGGLEIVNELRAGSISGVNRRLGMDDHYSVQPITSSAGSPVSVGGVEIFRLASENPLRPSNRNTLLLWLSLLFLLAASLLYLGATPSAKSLGLVALVQVLSIVSLYMYGRQLAETSQIFSPLLYADGAFRYSLGAVILANLLLSVLVSDFFIVRRTILRSLMRRNNKWFLWLMVAILLGAIVLIGVHLHVSLRSIAVNSNIALELYKVSLLNRYSALVYVSFLLLVICIPLLVQMAGPLLHTLIGLRYDAFSMKGNMAFSLVTGLYFVLVTSILGFRKEQRRVEVWTNRLAMERDVSLEMQLRAVEGSIAQDQLLGAAALLDGNDAIIRGRLVNQYMSRISQDYDISVISTSNPAAFSDELFNERIRTGTRLADDSHFFYSMLSGARAAYTGVFSYYVPDGGTSTLLVLVESKQNREDRGYLRLLGISDPGHVSLPPFYSYAKYVDTKLTRYKGAYPYPTVYSGTLRRIADGWCHFVHDISAGETVIISRPRTNITDFVVEGFFFALLTFGLLRLMRFRRRSGAAGKRYFQTRISIVIYVSLTLTLVSMAAFSVWFVYRRNASDMESVMTSRINSLQSMLQEKLRQVDSEEALRSTIVRDAMEEVGNDLRCDISLFTPQGALVMSTTPEVYDRMILGHRINETAYYNIIHEHKRYHMQLERFGRRSFYSLSAPVFNSSGRMVALVTSPFTDITRNLTTESIMHIATVFTLFLLLLLMARLITSEVIGRMFRPLQEIGRKMTVTNVDQLETIEYDQEDELTSLVQAYNRMVGDLRSSSVRLAQAERDKAWTDMARRVAHDLKNPLTPIKLQLQMLIRMKQSGNPQWQERFDDVARTVLYHVDLLADSADQFSTFAKMYDQAPERLDLDALLREEVSLFDSCDDVALEYIGLEGAMVTAPRPQLTRVVVNLLTNAIQALDDVNGEKRIFVALRNSADDGFYDIVVEDNGPGVDEDKQEKIFTADFTTKSSGSGLGLAICKRIVEHCGGSISYSRSFSLGGACFTVKYPRA